MDQAERDVLSIVIVGHVDHGKSTLIGRILNDTGSLTEAALAELEAVSARRGDVLEWSFLLDAFQAERDQAVTIDTTQIRFKTAQRDYIVIDAPGHREFLRNMISGAAQAQAAILVVDAVDGVQEQTLRHAYLLHLLGLRQVVVAINKMDMVASAETVFGALSGQISQYLHALGITPAAIVPVSAREGSMIASGALRPSWYEGPALLDALDALVLPAPALDEPLRLPIQDVYRIDERRILAGRIETGALGIGDTVLFSPTGEKATVATIETWPDRAEKNRAVAGESIGLTLDQPVFVERGHMASGEHDAPLLTNLFQATLFWLGAEPLKVGNSYKLRYATADRAVTVRSIDRVIDTQSLAAHEATEVPRGGVAEVTLRVRELLPLDAAADSSRMGRIVLYENNDIVGGGLVSLDAQKAQRRTRQPKSAHIRHVEPLVRRGARSRARGHRGGVFWFTGLPGAGKSTLSLHVEKTLFDKGYMTYVLDGDNIRGGLNADLGFSPADRAENIRRVGHVAALMADAGLVTITAFISPYREDRERARQAMPERFHEIYIKADLTTCETRDPKGLYKKARAGQIPDFTGISSPYETPENPDLVVDTQSADIDTCVRQIVDYIESQIALPAESKPRVS